MTNDTTNEQAGGEPATFPPNFYISPAEPPPSADLDLSQFEGMTPGPWIARNSNIGPIITNADNDGLATVGKWAARDAENAANHRAIAAVPALIAEVKRLREENAELSTGIKSLQGAVTNADRLYNEWEGLRNECDALKAEVERLKGENAGLKRNRCDNCGAATTGPCPDCGAPQCCPKCCAIDRLTTERDSLRADVERLTQELGEKTDAIQDAAKLIDRFRDQARRENESALRWEEKHNGLRAKIAELERDREALLEENNRLSMELTAVTNPPDGNAL